MIELTAKQVEALKAHPTPPQVVNPVTKETFVLLHLEEYKQLKEEQYDDSPWTREELQTLAWEAGRQAGWEDMQDYDDAPGIRLVD